MKSELITKELLEELYIHQELSPHKIAEQFGVSRTCINYNLKKHGITKRIPVRHNLEKDWLYDQHIVQNKSPHAIGKELGIPPKSVYNALQKYNIERIDFTKSIEPEETFNKLTTIKIIGERKNGTKIWLCECECGKETRVDTGQLKIGSVKSCGCIRKNVKRDFMIGLTGSKNYGWKGYEDISGHIWSGIKASAAHRNIEFDISIEYAWELFEKQNRKCALSNEFLLFYSSNNNKSLTTASLDRIDNNKGYINGNVWWVHKTVNRMKWVIPLQDFIYLCNKVANHKDFCHPIYLNKNDKYCINAIRSDTFYNAKRRKKDWLITDEELYNLYENQGGTCHLSGIPLYLGSSSGDSNKTASIDRLDNNKYYSINNVKWVHKLINMSRGTLSITDYIYWCQLISKDLHEYD